VLDAQGNSTSNLHNLNRLEHLAHRCSASAWSTCASATPAKTLSHSGTSKTSDPDAFDTAQVGNSNAGHEYGTGLSAAEKQALIEYLKVLPPEPELERR